MTTEKRCQWRRHSSRCENVATVEYRSVSMTLALCDLHWDGIRASLDRVFGSWERVAVVGEYA